MTERERLLDIALAEVEAENRLLRKDIEVLERKVAALEKALRAARRPANEEKAE